MKNLENVLGGWRRPNVAVTRARRRAEVICSFDPARLGRSNNRGVNDLARYLDYAPRVPVALEISTGKDALAETESPFEEAVLRVVGGWGYEVVPQVGTAGFRVDLGVRAPGESRRFRLGIECDGAMHHSSRIARDRDRLRQEILEGPAGACTGSGARAGTATGRARRTASARRSRRRSAAACGRPQPRFAPPRGRVRRARPRGPAHLDDSLPARDPPLPTQPRLRRRGCDHRAALVRAERRGGRGPDRRRLLVRRVIGAWEGSVVSERRRRAVDTVVASLVGARALARVGDAVRLAERTDAPVRVPYALDERTRREVKHVPQVELAAALMQLVGEAGTVAEDELGPKAARIYG